MTDQASLLAAYNDHLREEAEARDALAVERFGPLVWAEFHDGGFVTSRPLTDLTPDALEALVAASVVHFRDFTRVPLLEWKVRGDDHPDLVRTLRALGFEPQPEETVLAGHTAHLARLVPAPPGVVVRRAGSDGDLDGDVRRVVEAQHRQFTTVELSQAALDGIENHVRHWREQLRRRGDDLQIWLAEADGVVIGSGRMDVVSETPFAGLWGGGVALLWRGRGVYGTLVSHRAHAALERGATLLYCDCTRLSAPILRRAGMTAITTTTPYVLTLSRDGADGPAQPAVTDSISAGLLGTPDPSGYRPS